jgi:hypothetical protein
MKASRFPEHIIFLLVIILSLAFLLLAAISPSDFLDVNAVYQGF